MMRNMDKIVMLCAAAAIVLALAMIINAAAGLSAEVSGAGDDVRALAERANGNTLPPRPLDPAPLSGRVFGAWETPAIDLQQFNSTDFYPEASEVARPAPAAPLRRR